MMNHVSACLQCGQQMVDGDVGSGNADKLQSIPSIICIDTSVPTDCVRVLRRCGGIWGGESLATYREPIGERIGRLDVLSRFAQYR